MKHTVSILIPNWNGKELLARYIPSVIHAAQALKEQCLEIIVVDDGSTDESVSFIRSSFPHITLYALPHNRGFHRATNYGFLNCKGSIVILLNSDIEPEPLAFVPLIPHFNDPLLFGVNGRIYAEDKQTFLYGNRGGIFTWGHFSLREKSAFDTSQNLFVCGGAGAFDRDKFLTLGGFDTLFSPFYYEEQDISYRALKRGWHIDYEPASIMYHQIRGTIGKAMRSRRIGYLSARNNYLFVIKNITNPWWTLQAMIFIPLFLLRDLIRGRFRFWIAFLLALPRIPRALSARFKELPHIRVTDTAIFNMIRPRS